MIGLTLSMIIATFVESAYDTPTALYWIYRAQFFYGLLAFLSLNIFCVAMSRYPWKPKHGPFLMAHAGILILLFGSLLTFKFGLDGSLRVSEGNSQNVVELQSFNLVITQGNQTRTVPVPWIPPNATFRKISIPEVGVEIDQYLSHAEASVKFSKNTQNIPGARTFPAIHLQLKGGPMRMTTDFWLWTGDPSWTTTQAGPSRINFGPTAAPKAGEQARPGPVLDVLPTPEGGLRIQATSSSGEIKQFAFKAQEIQGKVIDPGWKGGVEITVLDWIADAESTVNYVPSETQYGDRAPYSAIHLVSTRQKSAGASAAIWLGVGDRASLSLGGASGDSVGLSYQPERVVLPFGISLDRFILEHYEGTRDPARYSSIVKVKEAGSVEAKPIEITMNEPLTHQGITFYQSSYEDAQPRPVTTVLSVNQDPGRIYKYLGSLLIVLGASWLFAAKTKSKKSKATESL
jgi:hypothetical protein